MRKHAELVRAVDPGLTIVDELTGGEGHSFRVRREQGTELLLKVLHLGVPPDEVRHAAVLEHPRIPAVIDVGALPDGRAFVLRAFVPGEVPTALASEPEALADQLLQLLEVVGFVHHRGRLHLDLKPSNVVLDEQGQVHLLDFGLAIEAGARARGGTPWFAAPEVMLGARPDARADIFSLGAMAAHALCRDRVDWLEVVRRRPGTLLVDACGFDAEQVPDNLLRFVTGATAEAPEQRFADATAAIEALTGSDSGRPTMATLRPVPQQVFFDVVDAAMAAAVDDADLVVAGGAAADRRAIALHLAAGTALGARLVESDDRVRVVRGGASEQEVRLPALDVARIEPHLRSVLGLSGKTATAAGQWLLQRAGTATALGDELQRLARQGVLVAAGAAWTWPGAHRGVFDEGGEADLADSAVEAATPAQIRQLAARGRIALAEAAWRASGDEAAAREALVEGLLDAGEPARALVLCADLAELRVLALIDTGRYELAARQLAAIAAHGSPRMLRAAARLMLAQGRAHDACRLLAGHDLDVAGELVLAAALEQTGQKDACERLIASLRQRVDAERMPLASASLYTLQGHLARRRADLTAAREAFARAAELTEAAGHVRHFGGALLNLGVVEKDLGLHEEAIASLRRARSLCAHVGDIGRVAIAGANLGIAALMRGEVDAATSALERAVDELDRLGDIASARLARVMLAQAHARAGRRDEAEGLLQVLGEPDDERLAEEVRTARSWLTRSGDAGDVRGMHDPDRAAGTGGALFRTFLAVNRKLAQTGELDDAMRTLLDAAVTLTGGRRGYLLVVRSDGLRREFDSGDDLAAQAFSRSLAHRAIDEQRTLTGADMLADEELRTMQSVRNLRVRSAVCTPFRSATGTRGAIYVEHPGRAGVFGDRECEALEVLADQAAIAVDRMLREEALRAELSHKQRELTVAMRAIPRKPSELLGESDAMRALRKEIDKLAELDLSVLITGETGTGKELVARALHERGHRRKGPFVAENCSALPAELMERELFGHVEGAFTGATQDRPGLLELANGGTMFLDEVGDMPPALQAKLLRVLQEREVRRIGASASVPLDLRVVAATHKDLQQMVRDGAFREDLYFRLVGVELHVPPLRNRGDDVLLLAEHFLQEHSEQRGVTLSFAPAAKALLSTYDWPGNVRELQHVVARAALLAEGGQVIDLQLPRAGATSSAPAAPADASEVLPLKEVERRAIAAALSACGGDKAKTARALGISRTALYDKLKRYDLS